MNSSLQTQRNHLARTAARRERLRKRWAIERLPTASPERAKLRETLRDLYELGLENTPSKAGFPEKPKGRAKKAGSRRRKPERTDATYRGARVNSHRSTRAQVLKAERIANGETRSQADRRRWGAARA